MQTPSKHSEDAVNGEGAILIGPQIAFRVPRHSELGAKSEQFSFDGFRD